MVVWISCSRYQKGEDQQSFTEQTTCRGFNCSTIHLIDVSRCDWHERSFYPLPLNTPCLYSSTVPQSAMRMDPPAQVSSRTSTSPPEVELLFPARLHALLSMAGRFGNIVGWTSCGTAWKVNCWTQFCSIILPLFVGGSAREHFVLFFELMNHWGFQQRELTMGDGCCNRGRFEDRVAFYHDYFQRDFPSLLCVLKPVPQPAHQQERIQQPTSSSAAGTTLHEDASLPPRLRSSPTDLVAEPMLLLPSSRLAPRTAQHRLTSSSTESNTSDSLQRAKQALTTTGTSSKCPPTSSNAQQELVDRARKQRPNGSTTAHGSACARQIRTTPFSVHQQQRGRFLSRVSSSVTSRLPAKKRMSEPLPDEDTDRHQQVVPVTKKTRKSKPTQGLRRKWLPPLGPPVITAGSTSNGVVVISDSSTSSYGGTATTAETWYCTNAETFADFASINNAHISHF
jgi:hypothetical protein